MLDYGAGGQGNFAAMPRVVKGKPSFKDPYGTNVEEYYPQNIMFDKRVHRGNSYAAMVIPAGTSHDTMIMEKRQTQKAQSLRQRTFKSSAKTPERIVPNYPNRDIPSPEPVMGRVHARLQTDEYIENLTDKPPTQEIGIATEFYLDRPPVPLFQPKMPAKENCKETQIFDNDWQLFDFDHEVEPMLNVLCLKTLEQARMEVLEETELAIMKHQKKQYEEVRNAELVEAQRFEAAEARVKAERERRANQQKARKQQRKNAHQKHVARVVGKKHLIGLKDYALGTLGSMSMMNKKLECDLHEEVLPWLMDQKDIFTGYQKDSVQMASQIIDKGISARRDAHMKTLKDRAARLKQDGDDAAMAGEHQKERRAMRKVERELRQKTKEKEELRTQVRRLLIDKALVVSPVVNGELLDIHGNYDRGNKYMGALGGQLQQLYYVVNAIFSVYSNENAALRDYTEKLREDPKAEALKNPHSPRELVLEFHFIPWLVQAIKELKCEQFSFLTHPKLDQLIQSFRLPKNGQEQPDLSRLTAEQYTAFRHAFVTERMFHDTYRANKGYQAMDLILSTFCMVLCNRLPKGVVQFRTENLNQKIKLAQPPKGVEPVERVVMDKENEVKIAKTTVERAVVRMLVPRRTMTRSEINDQEKGEDMASELGAKDGNPTSQPSSPVASSMRVGTAAKEEIDDKESIPRNASRMSRVSGAASERIVEVDQDDRACSIAGRIAPSANAPFYVYQLNNFAARAHRQDFIEQVRSKVYDYFQENPKALKELTDAAQAEAEAIDEHFINTRCDQFDLPCLDFSVNAADHE